MLAFPQLSSGGCAQYAFERSRSRRNVRNVMADGSVVTYRDSGAGLARWSLPFLHLSDNEAAAIEQLFDATAGKLGSFTFVDPGANLLCWSEDLTNPVWQHGPFLQSTNGIMDPRGTSRAWRLTNTGQATQRLAQRVAAPASFVYCFSVYARSTGGSALSLIRTGASEESTTTSLSSEWRRITTAGALSGDGNAITFSVELQPGAVVDVFGLQAEGQPGASAYMVTNSRGGVYTARFDQDELSIVAGARGSNDTKVRLISVDGDS